jgi:hypothetical protein
MLYFSPCKQSKTFGEQVRDRNKSIEGNNKAKLGRGYLFKYLLWQ